MNAIIAQDDRTKDLGGLNMPVVVIHGRGDRLVPVTHREATAAAVGGDVGLVVIDNMGHVISRKFYDTVVAALAKNARRGEKGEGLDVSKLDITLE